MKRGLLFLFTVTILKVSFLLGLTPISIQFLPDSDLPLVEVEIEGKSFFLEIDTGEHCELVLKNEFLNQIKNKTFYDTSQTVDIKGNIDTSPRYLISSITLPTSLENHAEALQFEAVIVREENMAFLRSGCVVAGSPKEKMGQAAGRIGWPFLQRLNWYFDFSHSLLWAVKDLDDLKNIGYFSLRDYVQTPFELSEAGIILSIDTNIGLKKFTLDTGANSPCLKQSLVNLNHAKEVSSGRWFFLSKIVIGGRHFGNHPLFLFEITPYFWMIDGIMGIQFFERNGIYLDFTNKTALIGPAKQPFWQRLKERCKAFWRWVIF